MKKTIRQLRYFKTHKGKEAQKRAQKIYDESDPERRRKQKRDYMRRKRLENPDYGKVKNGHKRT